MNMFRREPSAPAKNNCSDVEVRYLTLGAMALGKL